MSYLDWKVGDKVVCVDDAQWAPPSGVEYDAYDLVSDYIQRGRIYVLRDVYFDNGLNLVCVNVYGVSRAPTLQDIMSGACDPGFAAHRFRKVQPRATDISVFEAMLHEHRAPSKEVETT